MLGIRRGRHAYRRSGALLLATLRDRHEAALRRTRRYNVSAGSPASQVVKREPPAPGMRRSRLILAAGHPGLPPFTGDLALENSRCGSDSGSADGMSPRRWSDSSTESECAHSPAAGAARVPPTAQESDAGEQADIVQEKIPRQGWHGPLRETDRLLPALASIDGWRF